jgi:hypothetical protein
VATQYEWHRYWFDRSKPPELADGYLRDPDVLLARVAGHDLRELSELTEEPCLVLLGEPGLGKTYTVRRAVRDLEAELDEQTAVVKLIDLGATNDAGPLLGELAEGPLGKAWLEDGRTLHLFLDSLDEVSFRRHAVHRQLLDELREAAAGFSRLRLRVVCRSADWIEDFGNDLNDLLSPAHPTRKGQVSRYMNLAQLRAADVELAARVEGLDPAAFFAGVASHGFQELAALPLTLKMLMEAAKESGGLPKNRVELFERASRRLAGEHERGRRRAGRTGARRALTSGQRLAVAERIAAAALFSGQTAIAVESEEATSGVLDPARIEGFSEEPPGYAGGAAFKVGEDEIVEVLQTALFVDDGPGRVRFRHRSVGEFLAASYLVRHDLDDVQLISLLAAPGDDEERLIPQLREIAGWVAVLYPAALSTLLEHEPEVVLRVDRPQLSPAEAARVVDALLSEDVAAMVDLEDRHFAHNLGAVDHPDLAEALRVPLRDWRAPIRVRAVAIAIARSCQRRDLEPDLLELALGPEESVYLRALAVWGLAKFGSGETRAQLVPLALESTPNDEGGDVMGAALAATCPCHLDIEKTLASLTEPSEMARGGYAFFLRRVLPDLITSDDLPVALRWAAEVQPGRIDEADEFNLLVDAILEKAWSRLRDPEIGKQMAKVVGYRLACGATPFGRRHVEDDKSTFCDGDRRRMLLRHLVNHLGDGPMAMGEVEPADLLDARPQLLCREDIGWLLDRFEEAIGTPREGQWIALVGWCGVSDEPEFGRLFDLFDRSQRLRREVAPMFDDIPLGSMREEIMRQRHDIENPPGPPPFPEMDRRIEFTLEEFERGELKAWGRLNDQMRFGPPGADKDVDEHQVNLVRLPGWERADASTRERIVAAAHSFLERADPETAETLCELESVVLAGFRALHLVADREPFRLDQLAESTWGCWAPVVFRIDVRSESSAEDQILDLLFEKAAAAAPGELASWAAELIDRQVNKEDDEEEGEEEAGDEGNEEEEDEQRGEFLYGLWRVRRIYEPLVTEELLPRLASEEMGRWIPNLFAWAIEREPDRAVELVEPRLEPEAIARSPEGRAIARAIATILLRRMPSVGWPVTKRFLASDRELGLDVLRGVTVGESVDTTGFADPELVEFVSLLFEVFPPDDDSGALGDTDPDRQRAWVKETQSQMLAALAERGNAKALAALEELHDRYPIPQLRAALRAGKEMRRSRSPALAPEHVVKLCSVSDARLVFSERDLQLAVMASLGRIQRRVRTGSPPAAPQLWSPPPHRPRGEDELSNWLAHELTTDLRAGGKVINREVQVVPNPTGKGRPKSADIQVTAPLGEFVEGAGNARVLIEVKGCWERKVKSAMKDQLAENYLKRLDLKFGIYVVFWFPPDGWTAKDSNWGRGVSKLDLSAVRDLFEAQAEELNSTGRVSVGSFVFDCSLD